MILLMYMSREEGAIDEQDIGVRVLWGRSGPLSIRAVVFAVALFLAVVVFRYATMAAVEDVVYFDIARSAMDFVLWRGLVQTFSSPVLVVGLAAIHAYLNEGYLPSFLLGLAPVLGMNILIFSGPYPGPYVLTLKPIVGNWGWIPHVARVTFLWATVGFLVGFVVRWLWTEALDRSEPI